MKAPNKSLMVKRASILKVQFILRLPVAWKS